MFSRSLMEPKGQSQRRRYVSSSSPSGGTGDEIAVYDWRLVNVESSLSVIVKPERFSLQYS